MVLTIFSVYDSAAKAFMNPFFHGSRGSAIRSFQDAVDNKDTPFYRHPKDYTLFELGLYDDESARFTMEPAPVRIISAMELIPSPLPKNPQQLEIV